MYVFSDLNSLLDHFKNEQMKAAGKAADDKVRAKDREFAKGERYALAHVIDCLEDYIRNHK